MGYPKCTPISEKMLELYETVDKEIANAVSKFPEWPTDPLHAATILGEEFGELQKAVLQLTYEPHKTTPEQIRLEAIQTAAMAMRFLLSLDSYQYQQSIQHKQYSN